VKREASKLLFSFSICLDPVNGKKVRSAGAVAILICYLKLYFNNIEKLVDFKAPHHQNKGTGICKDFFGFFFLKDTYKY